VAASVAASVRARRSSAANSTSWSVRHVTADAAENAGATVGRVISSAGASLSGAGRLVSRSLRLNSSQSPRLSRKGGDNPAEVTAVQPIRKHKHSVSRVAIARQIFNEAKRLHKERPTYKAREADNETGKGLGPVIFKEVCNDVLCATRRWMCAVRMVSQMQAALGERAATRIRTKNNTDLLKSKVLVLSVFRNMHTRVRDDQERWETLWGSVSLSDASDSRKVVAVASGKSDQSFASVRSLSAPSRRPHRSGAINAATMDMMATLSLRSDASSAKPDEHAVPSKVTPRYEVASPVFLPGAVEEA